MAASQGGRESIEQEMEVTRNRLAHTVDQLVYRTNPKTIASRQVQSVKGYFVDAAGAPRTDHILKVAGGVAGAVAAIVILRKLVG